jgi:hypothetical protein
LVAPIVLATVPWSDAPPGLPPRMEQAPRSGWVMPDEVRLVPAPVHVRRDNTGALWVTNGAERIVRCGRPHHIELPDDGDRLLDLAMVSDRAYGLLDRVAHGTRLRWYDDAGLSWQREGEFGKILINGRRVYASQRHGPAVYEWDIGTGDPVRTLLRSPDAGEPYLVDGAFCAVFTDFAGGHRGVELLGRDGAVSRTVLSRPEHYAWLVQPIGFDKAHRPYAVRNGEIARIAAGGRIEPVGSVDPGLSPTLLQVDPDGRVLFAAATAEGVSVLGLTIDG